MKRLFAFLFCFAVLLPVAHAQKADSFFDIFMEEDTDDSQCDPCAYIRDEIEQYRAEADALKARIEELDRITTDLESALRQAEEAGAAAERALEDVQNPRDFVESHGVHYDSADSAAMRRRNDNLWSAYKSGDISAQEYSDMIGKPLSDPSVQKELARLKKQIEKELAKTVKEAKERSEDLRKKLDAVSDEALDLTGDLDAVYAVIEGLITQLDLCEERCGSAPVDPEAFQLPPLDFSAWEQLLQSMKEFFTSKPVTPGVEDALDELDVLGKIDWSNIGDFSAIPALPEQPEYVTVVCHLCDPLRDEVMSAEAALQAMQKEAADLDAKEANLWGAWRKVVDIRDAARRALDAFDNPSASAESEGRFMDSNDQAAMRARNARLWGEYRSGNLSAQELESEWAKPINDPSVQKELKKIKSRMRAELQKAFDEAEKTLKKLSDEINALSPRQIELAGKIAGNKVILEYLKKQLAECEKRCAEYNSTDDAEGALDDLIFPDGFESGDTSPDETIGGEEDGPVTETIKVPQECVSPAIPMSNCRQICTQTCSVSGVRAWQDAEGVHIEDCGICPPPQIDMCPNGTYFDKAECEKAKSCTCAEKAKSMLGASCYACVEWEEDKVETFGDSSSVSKDGFFCQLPLFGKWFCEVTEFTEDDDGVSSARSSGAATSEREDASSATSVDRDDEDHEDEDDEDEDEDDDFRSSQRTSISSKRSVVTSSVSDGPVSQRSSVSSAKTAVSSQKSSVSVKEECDSPTMTESACEKSCSGTCTKSYTRNDGIKCYECVQSAVSSSTSQSQTQPATSSSAKSQTPSCPGGSVEDKSVCDSQCVPQGGTCVQEHGCYSCVVVNCPNGTYKNECPSSCPNGCDVVGSQDGVSCYQCKQSCEDTCVRNGYDPPGTDYTSQILSTLNGYTCVSGASVSITTATIGSCSCTKAPNVTVNQTVPVCAATTCGDVSCGQSATCSPEPNTTVTVRCNWSGWKDLGNYKFQPIIGQ